MMPKVRAALGRFMQRDHLRIGGPAFLHDTRTLLGIALVVLGVRPEMPEAATWLAHTLSDPRLKPADRFHELIRSHVLTAITGQPAEPVRADTLIEPADLALVYWMTGQNTARLVDPADHRILSQRVMRAVMQADPAELTIPQAALLASAANAITNVSIDQVLLSRTHLSLLLRRFPAAMRRWRWDSGDRVKEPIHWPITSEREIQDILWLVLRSVFDDVTDEDTNPKVGHASTRADFGIPSLRLLVEVKYLYEGTTAEFKKIEQEVMIDSVAYSAARDPLRRDRCVHLRFDGLGRTSRAHPGHTDKGARHRGRHHRVATRRTCPREQQAQGEKGGRDRQRRLPQPRGQRRTGKGCDTQEPRRRRAHGVTQIR